MNKQKIFGAILIVLGLFTGICVIYASSHAGYVDTETSYKIGMLMGSAVTETAIGTLLNIFN